MSRDWNEAKEGAGLNLRGVLQAGARAHGRKGSEMETNWARVRNGRIPVWLELSEQGRTGVE